MSRIYFQDSLIWDKYRLPNEKQARRILSFYAPSASSEEMATALSAGIDVKTNEGYFRVELSTDGQHAPS